MTYTVTMTKEAEADLRGIYEYIAYVLHSPQNAAGQFSRLEEGIFSLENMPERYRHYDREPWRSREWRRMTIDHYCVFYMVEHERETVSITRILYGGRDMDSALAEGGQNS